ncbi:IucA/IucC family siderophore biosynthesis protein [uncultured Roseobacter sp.]|uniref:IucA/IucC family protein n=1 Tax=uncultured Roseobacter sp. TaxID=114847 RepID=UPI002611B281|nr:IucA/IucC family protein [uncultured Roseobacter sp.]
MKTTRLQSDTSALDAFLNSALREGMLRDPLLAKDYLSFADRTGSRVRVGLRAASSLRHLSDGRIDRDTGSTRTAESVDTLLSTLSAEGGEQFQARVLDSLEAIRAAPLPRPDPANWSFIEAEQALKAGHPFHPNPRSRDEMTTAEARLYAPEQEGRFPLHWMAADPETCIASTGAEPFLRKLAQSDGITAPQGTLPLPWHPWQAQRLLALPDVLRLLSTGQLHDLGHGSGDWAATSSMRCLHGWHAPFMVKTSLSLRLTNSTRHLSLREVRRGLHISDLLGSELGQRIARDFPTLHILGEPAFAALRGPSGETMEETMTVLRSNPFRDPAAPGPHVLAALCEAPPEGLSPLGSLVATLGANAARPWFRRFLDVAIWPLLELRARYGLLFGAHQQNLMLQLASNWPAAAWVRDCQGTGHLAEFNDLLTRASPGIGEGSENVVDTELGDGLVIYYLVVNSVLNTLATLVLDGLAREDELLDDWRAFLITSRDTTPGDATLYERLLTRPTLTCKGNFATSRSGVNEADGDARGQLASFFDLPNPLRETLTA